VTSSTRSTRRPSPVTWRSLVSLASASTPAGRFPLSDTRVREWERSVEPIRISFFSDLFFSSSSLVSLSQKNQNKKNLKKIIIKRWLRRRLDALRSGHERPAERRHHQGRARGARQAQEGQQGLLLHHVRRPLHARRGGRDRAVRRAGHRVVPRPYRRDGPGARAPAAVVEPSRRYADRCGRRGVLHEVGVHGQGGRRDPRR